MTKDAMATEREIDALMSGRAVTAPELQPLVPAVAALRDTASVAPSDDHVVAMGIALAEVVPAVPAVAWKRRTAWTVTLAGALTIGLAGTAAASDEAAPGDALYGVDRALEVVGVNAGGADERLREVCDLVERGDMDGAKDHAEESAGETDDEDGKGRLNAAASVLSHGSETSAEHRAQVAEMLMWMSETELTGREFGQAVAERAKGLGNGNGNGNGNGKSDEAPGDGEASQYGKDTAPGQLKKDEEPAKTEDDEAASGEGAADGGKPDDAGMPDDVGKPDDAGKPENPGKSNGKSKSDDADGSAP